MKKNITRLIVLVLVSLMQTAVLAETKTVTATGKFVMGDRDSKSDARQLALLHAKQMALEQAGTYLSSVTKTKNYELTSDEITSLAAGIMSVKVLDEKWTMEGESPAVTVTIEANIKTDDLDERVNALKEGTELVEDVSQLQAELNQLKKELEEMKTAKTEKTETTVRDKQDTIKKLITLDTITNIQNNKNKNPEAVVKELTKVIAKAPNNFLPYYYRAQAYKKIGKNKEALADAATALKLNPNSFQANFIKGQILMKKNKPDMALKYFTKTIALNGKFGPAYLHRGLIFKSKKQFVRALKDFKTACDCGVRKGCEMSRNMTKKGMKKRKMRKKHLR